MSRTQDGHVLSPVPGEATQPVGKLQVGTRRGRHRSCLSRDDRRRRHGHRGGGTLQADDLIGKTASAAQQHGPGSRLEKGAILRRDLVTAKYVHPAVTRADVTDQIPRGGQTRLAHPNQSFERLLKDLGICGALLVEDHQVDVKELQAPVFEGAEKLADYVEVLDFVDTDDDDGQVARNAVGPKARCPALVARKQARCRAK